MGGATAKEDDVLSLDVNAAGAADTRVPGTGTADPDRADDAVLSRVLGILDDSKADDVVTIDLRGKSAMADHMVICSGRSARQVSSIADRLLDTLKQELGVLARAEGQEAGDWVLIDAGDVIVHVFRPEVREFYQLEKMWLEPAAAATRA